MLMFVSWVVTLKMGGSMFLRYFGIYLQVPGITTQSRMSVDCEAWLGIWLFNDAVLILGIAYKKWEVKK